MPLVLSSPALCALPGDRSGDLSTRPTPGFLWASARPTPVAAPRILAVCDPVRELLTLERGWLESNEAMEILAGNRLAPGSEPCATAYGGHQFGSWAGQLGDGRAILLGTHRAGNGERFELQLKGAGPTAYSRRADGRAVLRSSLREFVCSEAMHALGIPTTRALSLVLTGDDVVRDMLYDGHPGAEPGAIVCRVAPSFVRFGHFELQRALGEVELLRRLADVVIADAYPDLAQSLDGEEKYAAFFMEVAERTARLVVSWMRVGFVHGVLNTDNMSILGVTIDYGPYGFVEDFDAGFTPNTTDRGTRRYGFGAQPLVASWNIERLAVALAPLFSSEKPLQEGIDAFARAHDEAARKMLAAKLGFDENQGEADDALARDLFGVLARCELDMTIFFRRLVDLDPHAPSADVVLSAVYREEAFASHRGDLEAWLGRYAARICGNRTSPDVRRQTMRGANPRIVFRNYLAQEAIDEVVQEGTSVKLEALMTALARPYDDAPDGFDARRPEWARTRVGCSMLSCSS